MKDEGTAYWLTVTSVIVAIMWSFLPVMTVNAGGGAGRGILLQFSEQFVQAYGKTLGIGAGLYTLSQLSPDQRLGLSRLSKCSGQVNCDQLGGKPLLLDQFPSSNLQTIDPSAHNTIYSFGIGLPQTKLDSSSLDTTSDFSARLRKILNDSSNPAN